MLAVYGDHLHAEGKIAQHLIQPGVHRFAHFDHVAPVHHGHADGEHPAAVVADDVHGNLNRPAGDLGDVAEPDDLHGARPPDPHVADGAHRVEGELGGDADSTFSV